MVSHTETVIEGERERREREREREREKREREKGRKSKEKRKDLSPDASLAAWQPRAREREYTAGSTPTSAQPPDAVGV